jgi:hypothetical protein
MMELVSTAIGIDGVLLDAIDVIAAHRPAGSVAQLDRGLA